jgi:hypothetical protein
MEKNVVSHDRLKRLLLSGALAAYGLTLSGWRRWMAIGLAGKIARTAALQR